MPNKSFGDKLAKTLAPIKTCTCHLNPDVQEARRCKCGFGADANQRRIAFVNGLTRRGIPFLRIGTHSYRKGSASYACCGTTAAPSIVAICLRAGWKISTVIDTYLQLEKAGDNFVGRIACGLDYFKKDFCVLPPAFPANLPEPAEQQISEAMRRQFPNVDRHAASTRPVFAHLFASLVYHKDFL